MGANGNGQIHFKDFEFDPASGQLLREGTPVRIQPQPLRVLRFLMEHAGQTVSREQLRDHIWGAATHVEFDQGLNYCIRQIRRALGDSAANPRYLETLPKQGYRFLVDVVCPERNGAANVMPLTLELPTDERPFEAPVSVVPAKTKHAWGLAAAGLSTLLVTAAAWTYLARNPHIASLAVLPLNNLSGNPRQDYFADGMTDELITMLAKNSTLRIISHSSVMQYKNAHRSVREIANGLGVDGILEGSVVRSADRVHLNVQLIDARKDAHIWAESFDRDPNSFASLPQEVAQSVARKLHSTVPQTAAGRYVRPEAHDAYLHGRYLWFTGHNDKAGEYFLKAAQLQPDYSLAWTGVADYFAAGAVDGHMSPKDSLRRAKVAAQKAVALDDSLAQAHVSSCAVALFADWNWLHALQECDRAIQLDPKFAEGYHLRAKILATLQRHDEAIQTERKALELNPFARPWGLVYVLRNARQYDAAISEARARLESAPTDVVLLWLLEACYRSQGRESEAVKTAQRISRLDGDTDGSATLARAFQEGGYRAVVLRWLTDWENRSKRGYVSPVFLAGLTAQLGERERTLALIEQGYEEHSPLLLELQFDPAYDFLHGEARYRSIVKKVGLPLDY